MPFRLQKLNWSRGTQRKILVYLISVCGILLGGTAIPEITRYQYHWATVSHGLVHIYFFRATSKLVSNVNICMYVCVRTCVYVRGGWRRRGRLVVVGGRRLVPQHDAVLHHVTVRTKLSEIFLL